MIPVPLSVRLKTSRTDIHVTNELRDLRYKRIDLGGNASAEFTISRPLGLMPEEIDYFSRVYIYGLSHIAEWEGRVEDLGIENSNDGQVWRIAAVGGMAHASDRTIPLYHIVRGPDGFIKARSASGEQQNTQVSAGEDPGGSGSQSLVCSFPTGMTVPTNGACTAYFLGIENADQNLAVFDYSWDAGLTSASWELRGFSSGTNVVRTQSASTGGGGTSTAIVGTGAFAFGDSRPILQFRWTGAASGTGTSDIVWASFKDIVMRTTTYTAGGTEQSSGYSSADKQILASVVVADAVGRLCPEFDGDNAVIETTTYQINELAWPDGIDARGIFDAMAELEPGFRWEVLESNADGKYRFRWVQRPTTVRYEADVDDGYSAPSSSNEVWNGVLVSYTDGLGQKVYVHRTSTVTELDDAGLTRETKLDLDASADATDAQQAGDEFLAEHARPPAQGRLTIARPIQDLTAGRMVHPWEIKAGELIRVRPLSAAPQAITATGRDGKSVFRIVSMEYDATTAQAILELDEYTRATSRALATGKRQAKTGKLGRRKL
jgi:hypothetical protein